MFNDLSLVAHIFQICCMAPTELKELKTQLQELLDRDSSYLVFRPRVCPFFLSKRKMTLYGCALIIGKYIR